GSSEGHGDVVPGMTSVANRDRNRLGTAAVIEPGIGELRTEGTVRTARCAESLLRNAERAPIHLTVALLVVHADDRIHARLRGELARACARGNRNEDALERLLRIPGESIGRREQHASDLSVVAAKTGDARREPSLLGVRSGDCGLDGHQAEDAEV